MSEDSDKYKKMYWSLRHEIKDDSKKENKEKNHGKTVQEMDREKLEQKFSKEKKESLN